MYTRPRRGCGCGCSNPVDNNMISMPVAEQNMFGNNFSMNNMQMQNECACGFKDQCNGLPEYPVLAQAYVPIQQMERTFTPEVGLSMGTIFPELVRPYMPLQSIADKEYIESANVIGGGCNNGY